MRKKFRIKNLFLPIFLCLLLPGFAFAEQLSYKIYTTADGLAHDNVHRIKRDSRGFLWFCTGEGLSRFDGYGFKNYTQEHGLPHRSVNDFLETADGTYLIATTNGLSVFNPNGRPFRWNLLEGRLERTSDEPPIFETYFLPAPNDKRISSIITSLAQTSDGTVYVGASSELYRFIRAGEGGWRFEKVEFAEWKERPVNFNALRVDSRNNLWAATNLAVYLLSAPGKIEKINDSGGNSIFEDREGKIWIDSGGNDLGIRVFEFRDGRPVLTGTYTTRDGLPDGRFSNAAVQTADGKILVVSGGNLNEFLPSAKDGEPKFRSMEINDVLAASIDENQNLWLGIAGKGVWKAPANGFVSYDEKDGFPGQVITSIFTNADGNIFVIGGFSGILRYDQGKFESVKPFGATDRSWGTTFLDFQASDGEWWVTTKEGLRRYPKMENFAALARTPPKKIYTTADGLFSDEVFNIFEDSRGDVWITATDGVDALLRWERKTEKIIRYTTADGLPKANGAISFGEDRSGNVWIGFYFGGLARFRDGKFQFFSAGDGIPQGYISDFLTDKRGRLWAATASRGLFYTDDPGAETPAFTNFSTADGLSSNQTMCLTEDDFGRVYVGTGRGINRLEPGSSNIRLYTRADGLPGNFISQCQRDKNGVLWFAATKSLVRFVPTLEKTSAPPPIFIDRISAGGVTQKISELGETTVRNLEFAPEQRQIQIDFFAVSFAPGDTLSYQYRLEGEEWSAPSANRTVAFNLSAGDYKFLVRAIRADGTTSENAAVVSFAIARPVWQRGWFVALAALIVAGLIFALDRFRVAKTRQVEAALVKSKESETRFRTLADTASDAILTIDEESRIVFANRAVTKTFGYELAELIGENLIVLMPENFRSGHTGGFNRYLKTKRKNMPWAGVELPGRHKNGTEIPLEVSFGEFTRGEKRYFTGIIRDITERRRAEEALRKAREERFKELERVRTRIATDLHDDIGSSLTQIAVLSEVARGQANFLQADNLLTPLERIKNVSKDLVAVMSDVVWAINPNKDFLGDLVQRMRRFASDVFSGRGIKFEFHAPESENNPSLGANVRREVFAIFKESVNNAVKYSECTLAKIDFTIEEGRLTLSIEDNGRGFDPKEVLSDDFRPEYGGNGLVNMRRRAVELGGSCLIESEIGRGTRVTLEIPLLSVEENGHAPAQTGGENKSEGA